MTFNRLPQFVKQVSGEVRQNKPAIKVLPVDGQTDPEMANVYSAIIRHIEGNCDAHRTYAKETEKACIGGAGWWRILSEYSADDSFDQELKIEGIPNPNAVVCDPDAKELSRCDMMFGFVTQMMSEAAFKAKYPDATLSDFDGSTGWRHGEFVRIAEYWEKYEVGSKTIYALEGPAGQEIHDEDAVNEMLPGEGSVEQRLEGLPITVKGKRSVTQYKVRSRLVSGFEPLTEWTEWPGQYIPLVRVTGEEVEAGDEVIRHGLIRHAKPPQIAYNYARNAMIERHATSTKSPWLIALKQIPAAFKGMWENAHRKNYPFLPYDPVQNAPPPSRIAPPAIDAAAYQESMVASEDMKATTGIYDAALGAKSNETSGVAIARRDAQGDTATYVYIDNMEAAITTTGRMLIDLIPHYYSDERVIRVLGEDAEIEKFVQINKLMPDGGKWNDITRGKYDVVVSTGPAYATRRQEAAQQMLQLVQSFPQLAGVAGDLIVKGLDVANADKIADRLKMTLPPGLDPETDRERQEQQQGQPQPPNPAEQAMQVEQQATAAKLQLMQAEQQTKLGLMQQDQMAKQALARDQFEFEAALALGKHDLAVQIAAQGAVLKTGQAIHGAALNEAAQAHSQGLAEQAQPDPQQGQPTGA
jgi:hypothetical protein